MDPELIARAQRAHAAIAAGRDPQLVAARFKELSGMDLPSPAALQTENAPVGDPVAEAQARLSAGGGNAVTDFLHTLAQGATGRFSDELMGIGSAAMGGDYTTARDEERQRINDLKLLAPGASAMGEAAGTVVMGTVPMGLTPAGAGINAVIKGKGLIPAIGRGAVAGGVTSGLFGAGGSEADTMKGRAMDAAKAVPAGAAVGGLLASIPVLGNAIKRRSAGRGERIAKVLEDGTGLGYQQGSDINAIRTEGQTLKGEASKIYQQLQAMAKEASGAEIKNSPITPKILKDMLPDGPMDFEAMQAVDQTLAVGTSAERAIGKQFRDAMEQVWPGYKDAVAKYRSGSEVFRALREGANKAKKGPADMEWAVSGAADPRSVRAGLIQPIYDELLSMADGSPAILKKWMNAGPSRLRQIRSLFPAGPEGDAGFTKLVGVINKEKSAAKVGQLLKPTAAKVGGAIGLGWLLKDKVAP